MGPQPGHRACAIPAIAWQGLSPARAAVRELLIANRYSTLSHSTRTMISRRIVLLMLGTAIAGAGLAIRGARSYAQQAAAHDVPAAQSGGTVVMLCDGKTSIEVKDLKPGQKLSRARAQAVSDELMDQWRRAH